MLSRYGYLDSPQVLGLNGSQTQGIAVEATNAQIDTLILDNRKKLNQIIGKRLCQCHKH